MRNDYQWLEASWVLVFGVLCVSSVPGLKGCCKKLTSFCEVACHLLLVMDMVNCG